MGEERKQEGIWERIMVRYRYWLVIAKRVVALLGDHNIHELTREETQPATALGVV